MGDECVTVVEMSVGAIEAADRADAVIRWLLDTGVIAPNPVRGDARQPSGYLPGPRAEAAAPGFRDTRRAGAEDRTRRTDDAATGNELTDNELTDNGVEILVERELYRDTSEHDAPACPDCGYELPEATLETLIRPWLDGDEPRVTCSGCGAARPLGEWPDGYLVGELAVRFVNWPPLSEAFLADLGSRMGPRWRTIREQY
ncbi:hypothetical protein HC031_18775 [Planosporangium thailandense]|uniref:Uncharacterized protein n=1 Tax=Planosporangium thailandense TaxID=765197 RepID=A0ABX0Y130_9ACTN|nr:hypothetical protein [Planosporangium thailandense]NJC71748.1 hypothetical protein [Planosporangium thailandense]